MKSLAWILGLVSLASGVACCGGGGPGDECASSQGCPEGYACTQSLTCIEASELTITTQYLPDGSLGADYAGLQVSLQAEGGIQPYRFQKIQGPDWLTISSTSGRLVGIPDQAGNHLLVEVQVIDDSAGLGQSAGKDLFLNVDAGSGCDTPSRTCFVEIDGTCFEGSQTCQDGEWSDCNNSQPSSSSEHCGPGCVSCDPVRSDGCVSGVCKCGLQMTCSEGQSCCTGECVDGSCGPACSSGDIRTCGSCGEGRQTCQPDNSWGSCENTGCEPGTQETCGCTGAGQRTCQPDCSWGSCGEGGECTPGSTEACGACGQRTCQPDCSWGSCSGGGCMPGEQQACGNCGSQTCDAQCSWGECVGQGSCSPGAEQDCGDCGVQVCNESCEWDACIGQGECPAGVVQDCGNCGLMTCSDQCTWGTCNSQGACAPGSTQACGDCGTRTCGDNCSWGSCTGQGVCSPGQEQSCGNCGTATCQNNCYFGACQNEGCAPGSTQACGDCGTQTCGNNCSWGSCTGEGECTPGSHRQCQISPGEPGSQTCSAQCAWGRCF